MRRSTVAWVAVVLIGAAIRLRGLDWGLPWALHIDERLFVVAKAIRLERSLAGDGVPDPGITSYGILPLWLLVLARKLFLGPASASGPPAYGDAFAGTVLLARWISAIWGTATIVLVGLWARRWGPAVAIVAAALVAGFPALVQASHFGTVEAPLVALLAGGMLVAERLAARPTVTRSLIGGIVLGLAVSVKAPGALLALPLLHAAAWDQRKQRIGRAAALLATAGIVALSLNPSLVTGPDVEVSQGEHTTLGGNLRRAFSTDFHDWTLPYANDVPVVTELTKVLPYAVGVLPLALALVGTGLMLRRRSGSDVRLLLVLIPILLLVIAASVKTVRFVLPALPALAVCAAVAAHALTGFAPRARSAALTVVAGLALLHGAAFSSIYSETDSRVAAARWIDDHVGPRDIVVVEDPPGYGPPIGSPSREVVRANVRYEILWRGFYSIHEKRSDLERRDHIDDVLRRAKYLVLSEGHRAEFTASPERRPVESAFYAGLDAGAGGFRKVAEFKAYPRLGPVVLRDDGAEVLMRVFDHPRIEVWEREEP